MNQSADNYFLEGCGRCALGGTPDCKVHNWSDALTFLRRILTESPLVESCKWGVPCYTHHGRNIVMLSAFKGFCSLSFFKGVLLSDPQKILVAPGPFSRSVRQFRFVDLEEVKAHESTIEDFITEAIEIEKSGLNVPKSESYDTIPPELQDRFDQDPLFKSAFDQLSPGRQRGYILYFSSATKTETRTARIQKYSDKILNGEGMHDAYRNRQKK